MGGKRVAWSTCQTRRTSEEEIRAWWAKRPTANVGVVTEGIFGIVVLDVDGEAGMHASERLSFALGDTSCVRTSCAHHYDYERLHAEGGHSRPPIGPHVVRRLGHAQPVAGHLAARRLRDLRRVAVE